MCLKGAINVRWGEKKTLTYIEKYFTVRMLSVAISEDLYVFDDTHNVYQAEGSCVVCNPACAVLNDNTLGLIVPQCATIYPQRPRIKTFWRDFAVFTANIGRT